MKIASDPISVVKYDAVVRLLSETPDLSHVEVGQRCKVAAATVERIWNGSISRPKVVVLIAFPRHGVARVVVPCAAVGHVFCARYVAGNTEIVSTIYRGSRSEHSRSR